MFKKISIVALVAAPVAAMAELPTGVSTAITSGGADGGTLMGLLAAAGAALYIVWKILKKAGIML